MQSPSNSSSSNPEWTLAEKIRLLELYMDRDMLWETRAEMLQKEFSRLRVAGFFTIQSIRHELHQIFNKPNPEHHVYGVPFHPRSKEAAELWLKHFRKEYAELLERKKQMFAVSMRKHLDLIRRYQQGKVTPEEIEATLEEQRAIDAKRADSDVYEAKLKEAIDKLDPDGLKNIRTMDDYCNFVRGDRIPTPPPEPEPRVEQPRRQPQVVPSLMSSPAHSFGSPEPVLKDIQNSGAKTLMVAQEELPTDILQEQTIGGGDREKLGHMEEKKKGKEQSEEIEEDEIEADVQMENKLLDGLTAVAEIVFPHSEWASVELGMHESILTKTIQTCTLANHIGAYECAEQTVRAPNITEAIEVTIQMMMPLLPPPPSPEKSPEAASPATALLTRSPSPKKPKLAKEQSPAAPKPRGGQSRTAAATQARLKRAAQRRQEQQQQKEAEEQKKAAAEPEQKPPPPQGRVLRRTATPKQEEAPAKSAPTAVRASRKRKRGELDLLSVGSTESDVSTTPVGSGPSRWNLRRSSQQTSPAPHPTTTTGVSPPTVVGVLLSPKPEPSPSADAVMATPPTPPAETETKPRPVISQIGITTKLRSSLRRAALASATPSPAVDSVGENGLFLRPGNHSSNEIIPKQVLHTLWKDIRSHRYSYVFDQPVNEVEVPGYHSAIKKPMDLKTLRARIESGAIQTFGQFSHDILLLFANAIMYNSTGHHVNTYAKEMLAYAQKCIQVVQYPGGMWAQTHPLSGSLGSRQSNASGSDGGDGRVSRSSTTTTSTTTQTNTTKVVQSSSSTQQTPLRSSRRTGGGTQSTASSSGEGKQRKSSNASIKQELADDEPQPSTSTESGGAGSATTRRRTSLRQH